MKWINSTGYNIQVEMVNSDFESEDFWQTETIILKNNDYVEEENGFSLNQDYVLVLNKKDVVGYGECREQDFQTGYIVLSKNN